MNDAKTDPKQIFLGALECRSPEERAQFLEQACAGDEVVRARVEQLLAAHQQAGNFLCGPSTDQSPIESMEHPGMVIGHYKLLEQIGEGGFGVVFLAEQERPVRRRVALKIIKPGMDTREVIARFEAERQALALMDHPNIAKVLDAGTTGEGVRRQVSGVSEQKSAFFPAPDTRHLIPNSGRPYFVMELVQGVPITEYCDQCNLSTRERLELFITVCQAVQHAHQKGIIHRDLKPTNVLVAIQDGEAAPKIIDFGVAKAINQQLTEHTLATGFAQMLGTPLYMSPEQAELSPLGVDTRSDIYSLGVLLYELLSGTTPFDKDRLHSASYDEMRRIIREEEPPRPSARISTLAADQVTTIAEHRRTDSRRLSQQVRGELDWIVMKCLEKDRNRRYDSAGALARDVERYLNNETVQACPPSIPYRLKKFIRRNRAAAAFICLLIFGVAALTVSNIRSRRSEQRAISEGAKAKAISDLLQEMLGSADAARGKGVDYTVRELFDDFSESLGSQLADQPDAEAEIHATIGRAYRSLKLPYRAQPHFEKAIEIRRHRDGPHSEKLAAVLVDGAWNLHDQVRREEAESQLNEALSIYRQRGVAGAPLFHALEVLQHVLISSGRDADAERITEQALAVARNTNEALPDQANLLHRYAGLKINQGRFAEAEQIAQQAVDMHRRLHGEQHPETAFGLKTLGRALQARQKLADAEQAFREALQVFRHQFSDDHFNIQDTNEQLKSVLEARGDKAALEEFTKEEVDEESRSDLPGYHLRMAGLLLRDRPPAAAASDVAHQLIRRATEGYGQVAIDSPDDLERRLKAVDGYVEVAKLCAADPDFAQEVDEAHRMLSTDLAGLLTSFPDSTCQEQVGHKYRLWASAVGQNSKHLSQFERAHNEAIKCFEDVLTANPDMPGIRFCVANSYVHLGDVQKRLHRPDDARASFARAMEIYEQHAAEIAIDATVNAWEMASDYFRAAGLFTNNFHGKRDRARRLVQRVMDGYGQVAIRYPGDLNRRLNALNGYAILVGLCAAVPGFENEGDELNRRLEAELPKLLEEFPDSGDCLWNTANVYRRWAVESAWDNTDRPMAERAIRESIKLHEKVSMTEPTRPGVWLYQADRNIVLGYLLWHSAGPDEAEAPYRRAMEIFNNHAAEIAADTSAQAPLAIIIDSAWLADFFGCTDRPDEAAELLRKATDTAKRVTDPVELALAHYFIALLQARLGDDTGYRDSCRALADVAIANADDYTKSRTILTWCHAPDALADLSLVVQRAEEFAAHHAVDQPHIVPYVLGAALYRNGQYERAAEELEKAIAAHPSDPPPWNRIINWQRLFLAMTQWQLGQRDEAQRLLAEIQPDIEAELQSPTTPMEYRITLEILRREAQALIKP